MMKRIIACLIAVMGLNLALFAEETKMVFELGAGGKYDAAIYKDGKDLLIPVPLINVRYGMFAVEFDKAKCYINEDFSLTVGTGNNGYDNIKGMDDRKMAITAGIDYNLRIVLGTTIKMNIYENFFESKNGLSGEVMLEQIIPVTDNDYIFISGGTKYIDNNISDYYYGVKESESTSERKSYKGKGTFIPKLGLNYVKVFTPNIYFFITNKVGFYLNEISDSPVVDKKYEYVSNIGVVYKFKP